MTSLSNSIGKATAEYLFGQSEQDARVTPMDAVLRVAQMGRLTDDQCFRLLARTWTLKRLLYYVYGGWAQGINLNEYPPSVAYLFGKQIHDDSTQEMQLSDEILRRGWVVTQKQLFAHPYAQFDIPTRTGAYIFCLRALANYPQNVRIAALNLGPKVIELAWTEKFAASIPDEALHALFQSQLAETRSHVLMGKFKTEQFIQKEVDAELAKRLCAETRRDYLFFLEETARFVLGMGEEKGGEVTVQADID
ncbi:MAG TPA: hypothetical protein VMT22_17475 [Terriglobales bacterium]|jgi:hypothetical protein|nr:hypothetical protein [Terriglobales bacterium]